jgi:hypothetical protein
VELAVEKVDPETQFDEIPRNPSQTTTKEAACEMVLGAKF